MIKHILEFKRERNVMKRTSETPPLPNPRFLINQPEQLVSRQHINSFARIFLLRGNGWDAVAIESRRYGLPVDELRLYLVLYRMQAHSSLVYPSIACCACMHATSHIA